MSIVKSIQAQRDDGKYSAGSFADLKKAFDFVDHNILLKKLDYYGVRGIANELFASYLKNRKQFVSIRFNSFQLYLKYSGNSNRFSTGFCFRTPPISIIYK